jgi:hypothetical protein
MDNNGIDRATVSEATGKIKQGKITYVDKMQELSFDLENEEVHGATGRFEFNESKNVFEGSLDVIIRKDNKFISGNLVNGTAEQGFKIRLRFLKEE